MVLEIQFQARDLRGYLRVQHARLHPTLFWRKAKPLVSISPEILQSRGVSGPAMQFIVASYVEVVFPVHVLHEPRDIRLLRRPRLP